VLHYFPTQEEQPAILSTTMASICSRHPREYTSLIGGPRRESTFPEPAAPRPTLPCAHHHHISHSRHDAVIIRCRHPAHHRMSTPNRPRSRPGSAPASAFYIRQSSISLSTTSELRYPYSHTSTYIRPCTTIYQTNKHCCLANN